MTDLVTKIMQWESGEMSEKDTIEFFAELIKSGMAWSLQGCYGRTAHSLIENGIIDTKGEITQKAKDLMAQSEE